MNMAAREPRTELQRLQTARERLARIQPARWHRSMDDHGEFLEARDEHGEFVELARFTPRATFDEIAFIADAPEMAGFLLGLVDRAIEKARRGAATRQQAEPARQDAPRDFAAEATMKCNEPAFRRFLAEQHGLEPPLTKDRAVVKLRSILAITSRRELNGNGQAAERWKALRAAFKAWRAVG